MVTGRRRKNFRFAGSVRVRGGKGCKGRGHAPAVVEGMIDAVRFCRRRGFHVVMNTAPFTALKTWITSPRSISLSVRRIDLSKSIQLREISRVGACYSWEQLGLVRPIWQLQFFQG